MITKGEDDDPISNQDRKESWNKCTKNILSKKLSERECTAMSTDEDGNDIDDEDRNDNEKDNKDDDNNIVSLISREDIVAPTSNSHNSDHHVFNNCLNGGSLEENCEANFCPAC